MPFTSKFSKYCTAPILALLTIPTFSISASASAFVRLDTTIDGGLVGENIGGSSYGSLSSDGSTIATSIDNTSSTENLMTYTDLQGITDLSNLGEHRIRANGISSNGGTIVGTSYNIGASGSYDNLFSYRAFKYTESGGLVELGFIDVDGDPPRHSGANAVSADGNAIVGYSATDTPYVLRAFLYTTESDIMVDLGDLNDGASTDTFATLISSDGQIISGYSDTATASHAFKYDRSTGLMVDMGDFNAGSSTSRAADISADGSVIVGYSQIAEYIDIIDYTYYIDKAFKYTDQTEMVDLGGINGNLDTNFASEANAVSSDGSTIVGTITYYEDEVDRAFKYTESSGMVDLGHLYHTELNLVIDNSDIWLSTQALDVSADGKITVGQNILRTESPPDYDSVFLSRAFVHSDETGIVDLGDLGDGVTETYAAAYDVSDDGTVISGISETASGDLHLFVAKTFVIDVQNTYASLYSNGYQLNSILNLNNSSLEYALDQDSTVFGENNVSVTVGTRYTNVKGTTAQESTANLKVAYRFNDKFRAGIFLDQTVANSMPHDFDIRNPQPLVGIFAAYSQKTDGTGLQARVSGAYNSSTLTITRNDNLAHTEAGQGRTKLISQGLLAEMSYGVKISDKWNVQPYAGVRRTTVERTGYTESTGADFPITYDDLTKKATTAFAGVRFSGYLTRHLGAKLSAGYEHDTVNSVDGYAGNIAYMGSFDLDQPSLRRNRAVASIGGFYNLKENQNVGFGARYAQQALNNGNGVTAYLNYTIGF